MSASLLNNNTNDFKSKYRRRLKIRYPKLIVVLQFCFGVLVGVLAPSVAMCDGRWMLGDGCWAMDNGRWTMDKVFMQKSNAKPANVEIKPVALHEAYKIPVI